MSNRVEFTDHFYLTKNAENVKDNIWRIYFLQDLDILQFRSMMLYSGAIGMTPVLLWAQICHDNPTITISIIDTTTTEFPGTITIPDMELCIELWDYTYDVTRKRINIVFVSYEVKVNR